MVAVAERARTVGKQAPRIHFAPKRGKSRGIEAVEFAFSYGLELDEWQQRVLVDGCRMKAGRWASFEVGLCVGRQNGKGSVLVARELAGMFLWGEELIIHSAHQYDTSLEHFARLFSYVESSDELSRRLKKKPTWTHGMEGFELVSGERIRFRTRTRGGGRGFSGDLLVFDEAMFLPQFAHGALMPILSARENPQVWYAGSAVDQEVHENGYVFAGLRKRAVEEKDHTLAFFEWSLDLNHPGEVEDEIASSPDAWAQANPALGLRISEDYLEAEHNALDDRSFAVERLGVGDWPDLDTAAASVIPLDRWDELVDAGSRLEDPVCLAFDVSPDRQAAIAAAGRRPDGLFHVEITDSRSGTGWLAPRLLELQERHSPTAIVCDAYGPVASVVQSAEGEGVVLQTVTTSEHVQACGRLVDLVEEKLMRHLGSDELRRAIRGAKTRPLGDAWAWSRKSSSVDISPLVAATLALYAAGAAAEAEPEIMVAMA